VSNELTAALAEQLAASEALVRRSADARAAALGTTPDAVLAAWSGAAAPPAPVRPEPAAPREPEPEPVLPEPKPEAVTEAVVSPAPAEEQASAPAATRQEEAPAPLREPEPVSSGSLGSLVLGSLVIFAIMLIATVVAPSSSPNAQTLDAVERIELSADALQGREVYLAEGCAYCHTQQVRPIVTDADLGVVTLSDSPLVPGFQRLGPDLAHVGSRAPTDSGSRLTGYLTDPAAFNQSSRPSFDYLSSRDIESIVAYLLESK